MDQINIIEDMEAEIKDIIDLDFAKVERGFRCSSWAEMLRERDRRAKEEALERAKYKLEARFFIAPNW